MQKLRVETNYESLLKSLDDSYTFAEKILDFAYKMLDDNDDDIFYKKSLSNLEKILDLLDECIENTNDIYIETLIPEHPIIALNCIKRYLPEEESIWVEADSNIGYIFTELKQ